MRNLHPLINDAMIHDIRETRAQNSSKGVLVLVAASELETFVLALRVAFQPGVYGTRASYKSSERHKNTLRDITRADQEIALALETIGDPTLRTVEDLRNPKQRLIAVASIELFIELVESSPDGKDLPSWLIVLVSKRGSRRTHTLEFRGKHLRDAADAG